MDALITSLSKSREKVNVLYFAVEEPEKEINTGMEIGKKALEVSRESHPVAVGPADDVLGFLVARIKVSQGTFFSQ